ncbi:hypothetical protein [Weissella minor]|uniref:Uncharacterized protein n=1 Tax=Weissella minor TaxID=1620 RepID=A0A0R2JLM3_9LACO|nr:hypothetical protein [Weissella minor]KRN78112.1 hypothetical protein IV67_GL001422 [Weissella minor]
METGNKEFKSVTDLAEYLKISRKTLYKRSKANGVNLSGSYSERDLRILKQESVTSSKHKSVTTVTGGDSESKQIKSTVFETLKAHIDTLKADKIFLQKEIESKNITISETTKLLDQAQQLQLDLQTKLNHSEQERLALLDTANKSTNSDEYLHELKENIAELKEQISSEKQAKESLQTELKNSEHFSDYLFRENQQLDDLKEELTKTLDALEDKQQHLDTLQHELNETQGIAQEKAKQRQSIAEENKTLREQLTKTRQKLQDEQNKSFWQRLFGR